MSSHILHSQTSARRTSPSASARTTKSYHRFVWPIFFTLLLIVTTVAFIGPQDLAWRGAVIGASRTDAMLGDHIQISYYLWLWRHALVTLSHLPWLDPFQFAATGHTTYQPFGWPLVLVSLPVQAMAGPIAALNTLTIVSFGTSALTTYLWIRALGLSRRAATVAGFAFAFAPFRVLQTGHINAMLSFLIPLCLYFAERALRGPPERARLAAWGFAASYVSLTASGEMHLVLYITPVLAVYMVVRGWRVDRNRLKDLLLPAVITLLGSAFFLASTYTFVLARSVRGVEPAVEVAHDYAPRLGDVLRKPCARGMWPLGCLTNAERSAYPGVVIALLAVVGVAVALSRRHLRPIGIVFGISAIAAYALAIAPGLVGHPLVLRIYRLIPFVDYVKVPGRVLIVAVLAFALLAAVAFDALPRWIGRVALLIVLALIPLDSDAFTVGRLANDRSEPNLMAGVPSSAAVLDLPPFENRMVSGSRYMTQIMHNPGPRVGGYSVFVTPEARALQRSTQPLVAVDVDPCRWLEASRSVDFDFVAIHLALFGDHGLQWHVDGQAFLDALERTPGFSRVSQTQDVVVLRFQPERLRCGR